MSKLISLGLVAKETKGPTILKAHTEILGTCAPGSVFVSATCNP
jgi:hypothetical protein